MQRALKKIYTDLSLLLLIFIILFIIGCSGTGSTFSKTVKSLESKDQIVSEDSDGENKTNQQGVPLPPDEANGIFITDGLAYVADYMTGLSVFDISDKSNPVKISELDLSGDGMDVFISGKFAYVACGYSGLQIIDISDIKNMRTVSSFKQEDSSNDYATRLQVKDNLVFLADSVGGFKIIDASVPEAPEIISKFGSTYQGSIEDVTVDGNTAFLADYRAGFIVVDIRDLKNPKLVSETRTTGMAKGVCRIETGQEKSSYVLVADYKDIKVIDISDTSNPVIAGNYNGLKNAVSITSYGSTAFAADYNLGIVQLDITEITNPVLVKTFDTGKTNDVCVYDGYVYAVGEKGISAFKIE
jgi:hypothetical protein